MVVFFYSCQKDTFYSCDEQINNWVKENYAAIQELNLTEWRSLDRSLQIPSYRAIPANKKASFWKEKTMEILKQNWTTPQKEAILNLFNTINANPQWFENQLSIEERDNLEIFTYEWLDYAEIEAQFTKDQIIAISGTLLETNIDSSIIDTTNSTQAKVSTRGLPDEINHGRCDCYTGQEFFCQDFGMTPSKKCYDHTDCKATLNLGCGFLLFYSCNGICWYD